LLIYGYFNLLTLFIKIKVLFVDRSRGFGFVIFTSPEALDSVQEARPHEIDGRVVDTKRALPKSVSQNAFYINV